jgi:hypothetical protein
MIFRKSSGLVSAGEASRKRAGNPEEKTSQQNEENHFERSERKKREAKHVGGTEELQNF